MSPEKVNRNSVAKISMGWSKPPDFGADRVVFIPRVEQVEDEWRVTFFGAYLVSAAEQFGVDLFDYRCPTHDWL
jgi:hypothetical protein